MPASAAVCSLLISIHALREEGDLMPALRTTCLVDFNPRPPRGGRPDFSVRDSTFIRFQSTPSARRATAMVDKIYHAVVFQSTPSARRATVYNREIYADGSISIHALREEGDTSCSKNHPAIGYFNPRPPRGGRPVCLGRFGGAVIFQSTPSARRATFPLPDAAV